MRAIDTIKSCCGKQTLSNGNLEIDIETIKNVYMQMSFLLHYLINKMQKSLMNYNSYTV